MNADFPHWNERLLAVWRRSRRTSGGPQGELTAPEAREVASSVRRLSLGLTRERSLPGTRYLDDPKALGAYLLYFWPISYWQARRVFAELPRRPRRVLDLGSGPAPLAFAALDAGATEAVAVDRSPAALALARDLAIEAGEALSTRVADVQHGIPAQLLSGQSFDLIVVGHLLNEIFLGREEAIPPRAEWAEQVASHLAPGGSLVLLEPALRDTSRELLRVRDALVQRGFAVRAPCFYRGNCPALVKESDWCHAEREWEMPRTVEQLARAAGLHKESLKMSYLILAPRGEEWHPPPPGRVFRIVSEALRGKGRRRYMGCGPEGRLGLALQEKHRTPRNEAFFHLSRGDVVEVTDVEARGDGLALGAGSTVTIVAKADSPVHALTRPRSSRPSIR